MGGAVSAGRDPGVIPEIRFCVATTEGPVRVDVVGLVRDPKSGQLLAVHRPLPGGGPFAVGWRVSAWNGGLVVGDARAVDAARAALRRIGRYTDRDGDFAALLRNTEGVENPPPPPLRREWFLLPEQRDAFDESWSAPS